MQYGVKFDQGRLESIDGTSRLLLAAQQDDRRLCPLGLVDVSSAQRGGGFCVCGESIEDGGVALIGNSAGLGIGELD